MVKVLGLSEDNEEPEERQQVVEFLVNILFSRVSPTPSTVTAGYKHQLEGG